jgi:hypothetical protein
MIEPTFQNLILTVPIAEETKNLIKNKYEHFDTDQKTEILYLLWDMYLAYRKILKEQLRAQYEEKMINELFVPPEDLDTYIEKEVEKKVKEQFYDVKEEMEIKKIRSKIEKLIGVKPLIPQSVPPEVSK